MRGLLLLLSFAVIVLAAGCGGEGGMKSWATGAGQPPVPAEFRIPPGPTLRRFVRAAHDRDVAGMWMLLSGRSRLQLGPSLARFRARSAARIETVAGRFGSRTRIVFSQPLGGRLAVAAVALGKGKRRVVHAAPLRFGRGAWHVEIGDPLRVRILFPDPGGSVESPTPGLVAEIDARASIVDGELWLDGQPFEFKSGGLTDRRITMYGHAAEGATPPGYHFAIAYAQAGYSVTTVAWTFSSRPYR